MNGVLTFIGLTIFQVKYALLLGAPDQDPPRYELDRVRDVVLAQTASFAGSPSRTIFKELNFAPVADFGLLAAAAFGFSLASAVSPLTRYLSAVVSRYSTPALPPRTASPPVFRTP